MALMDCQLVWNTLYITQPHHISLPVCSWAWEGVFFGWVLVDIAHGEDSVHVNVQELADPKQKGRVQWVCVCVYECVLCMYMGVCVERAGNNTLGIHNSAVVAKSLQYIIKKIWRVPLHIASVTSPNIAEWINKPMQSESIS